MAMMRLVVFWRKHTAAANPDMSIAFNHGWYFSAYICKMLVCKTFVFLVVYLPISQQESVSYIFVFFPLTTVEKHGETEIPLERADLDVQRDDLKEVAWFCIDFLKTGARKPTPGRHIL